MKCPYSVTKNVIQYIRNVLSVPDPEFSGFAPCPFVKPEYENKRLMIEMLVPDSNETLVDIIHRFSNSNFKSLLIVQDTMEMDITAEETIAYQSFINRILKAMKLTNYKCLCFNPNDAFAVRQKSPYFLINIAERNVLSKAHKKLMNTEYFSKLSAEYLNFLHVNTKK